MTLLQCINEFLDNISVTDRQEENIKGSLSNLDSYLLAEDSGLSVDETFTNGSYERDTIIRPLDDIDVFAVLNRDKWKDESGNLPDPQSVLTRFKNYLNDQSDYKDKVKQDRPCVTIRLSDKDFDVLPSFKNSDNSYSIPGFDLKNWTYSWPQQLMTQLDNVHRFRNYRVKQVIRAVKHWNRDNNNKTIPSYHIEEIAISIFSVNNFSNYEEAIRAWFNNAEYNMLSHKFRSNDEYNQSLKRIQKTGDKLNEAKKLLDDVDEAEAIKIWKDIFDKDFPTVSEEEAKDLARSLSEGTLKIAKGGALSNVLGSAVIGSKGFYGKH